jgi:hypothetical protein
MTTEPAREQHIAGLVCAPYLCNQIRGVHIIEYMPPNVAESSGKDLVNFNVYIRLWTPIVLDSGYKTIYGPTLVLGANP